METENIIPFAFGDNLIRVFPIEGEPWWVAKDVANALGIVWQGEKTLEKIKSEWRVVGKLPTTQKNQHGEGGIQEKDAILINEAAVYKLAFRSNKAEAERFVDWVASEVLPSIRRTGKYEAKPLEGETSAPALEHQPFPEWPMEEMRTKRAIVDMYRLLYGGVAGQWIAPQLGFPTPPIEFVEHGRQIVIVFPQTPKAA